MYRRILVPLDGSETAAQVLPYAQRLAAVLGAGMELVEVITPLPEYLAARAIGRPGAGVAFPPNTAQWNEIQAQGRAAAQERLEGVARSLRRGGTPVQVTVLEADPVEGIVTLAAEQAGTLVAMSTHGRSGLGRWVLGSVTDKVVRMADQPVLVVRAREAGVREAALTRVVLPLDGSEASEAALPHAVSLAKVLGIGVTLVRSISPLAYGDTFADYVPALYADLNAEIDAEVQGYLERTAAQVREYGVTDVEVSAPDGYPATAILEEAGTAGDRLVVMATHARSGIGRWVLGSVADRVVRHAVGPVLLVRPEETQGP